MSLDNDEFDELDEEFNDEEEEQQEYDAEDHFENEIMSAHVKIKIDIQHIIQLFKDLKLKPSKEKQNEVVKKVKSFYEYLKIVYDETPQAELFVEYDDKIHGSYEKYFVLLANNAEKAEEEYEEVEEEKEEKEDEDNSVEKQKFNDHLNFIVPNIESVKSLSEYSSVKKRLLKYLESFKSAYFYNDIVKKVKEMLIDVSTIQEANQKISETLAYLDQYVIDGFESTPVETNFVVDIIDVPEFEESKNGTLYKFSTIKNSLFKSIRKYQQKFFYKDLIKELTAALDIHEINNSDNFVEVAKNKIQAANKILNKYKNPIIVFKKEDTYEIYQIFKQLDKVFKKDEYIDYFTFKKVKNVQPTLEEIVEKFGRFIKSEYFNELTSNLKILYNPDLKYEESKNVIVKSFYNSKIEVQQLLENTDIYDDIIKEMKIKSMDNAYQTIDKIITKVKELVDESNLDEQLKTNVKNAFNKVEEELEKKKEELMSYDDISDFHAFFDDFIIQVTATKLVDAFSQEPEIAEKLLSVRFKEVIKDDRNRMLLEIFERHVRTIMKNNNIVEKNLYDYFNLNLNKDEIYQEIIDLLEIHPSEYNKYINLLDDILNFAVYPIDNFNTTSLEDETRFSYEVQTFNKDLREGNIKLATTKIPVIKNDTYLKCFIKSNKIIGEQFNNFPKQKQYDLINDLALKILEDGIDDENFKFYETFECELNKKEYERFHEPKDVVDNDSYFCGYFSNTFADSIIQQIPQYLKRTIILSIISIDSYVKFKTEWGTSELYEINKNKYETLENYILNKIFETPAIYRFVNKETKNVFNIFYKGTIYKIKFIRFCNNIDMDDIHEYIKIIRNSKILSYVLNFMNYDGKLTGFQIQSAKNRYNEIKMYDEFLDINSNIQQISQNLEDTCKAKIIEHINTILEILNIDNEDAEYVYDSLMSQYKENVKNKTRKQEEYMSYEKSVDFYTYSQIQLVKDKLGNDLTNFLLYGIDDVKYKDPLDSGLITFSESFINYYSYYPKLFIDLLQKYMISKFMPDVYDIEEHDPILTFEQFKNFYDPVELKNFNFDVDFSYKSIHQIIRRNYKGDSLVQYKKYFILLNNYYLWKSSVKAMESQVSALATTEKNVELTRRCLSLYKDMTTRDVSISMREFWKNSKINIFKYNKNKKDLKNIMKSLNMETIDQNEFIDFYLQQIINIVDKFDKYCAKISENTAMYEFIMRPLIPPTNLKIDNYEDFIADTVLTFYLNPITNVNLVPKSDSEKTEQGIKTTERRLFDIYSIEDLIEKIPIEFCEKLQEKIKYKYVEKVEIKEIELDPNGDPNEYYNKIRELAKYKYIQNADSEPETKLAVIDTVLDTKINKKKVNKSIIERFENIKNISKIIDKNEAYLIQHNLYCTINGETFPVYENNGIYYRKVISSPQNYNHGILVGRRKNNKLYTTLILNGTYGTYRIYHKTSQWLLSSINQTFSRDISSSNTNSYIIINNIEIGIQYIDENDISTIEQLENLNVKVKTGNDPMKMLGTDSMSYDSIEYTINDYSWEFVDKSLIQIRAEIKESLFDKKTKQYGIKIKYHIIHYGNKTIYSKLIKHREKIFPIPVYYTENLVPVYGINQTGALRKLIMSGEMSMWLKDKITISEKTIEDKKIIVDLLDKCPKSNVNLFQNWILGKMVIDQNLNEIKDRPIFYIPNPNYDPENKKSNKFISKAEILKIKELQNWIKNCYDNDYMIISETTLKNIKRYENDSNLYLVNKKTFYTFSGSVPFIIDETVQESMINMSDYYLEHIYKEKTLKTPIYYKIGAPYNHPRSVFKHNDINYAYNPDDVAKQNLYKIYNDVFPDNIPSSKLFEYSDSIYENIKPIVPISKFKRIEYVAIHNFKPYNVWEWKPEEEEGYNIQENIDKWAKLKMNAISYLQEQVKLHSETSLEYILAYKNITDSLVVERHKLKKVILTARDKNLKELMLNEQMQLDICRQIKTNKNEFEKKFVQKVYNGLIDYTMYYGTTVPMINIRDKLEHINKSLAPFKLTILPSLHFDISEAEIIDFVSKKNLITFSPGLMPYFKRSNIDPKNLYPYYESRSDDYILVTKYDTYDILSRMIRKTHIEPIIIDGKKYTTLIEALKYIIKYYRSGINEKILKKTDPIVYDLYDLLKILGNMYQRNMENVSSGSVIKLPEYSYKVTRCALVCNIDLTRYKFNKPLPEEMEKDYKFEQLHNHVLKNGEAYKNNIKRFNQLLLQNDLTSDNLFVQYLKGDSLYKKISLSLK